MHSPHAFSSKPQNHALTRSAELRQQRIAPILLSRWHHVIHIDLNSRGLLNELDSQYESAP